MYTACNRFAQIAYGDETSTDYQIFIQECRVVFERDHSTLLDMLQESDLVIWRNNITIVAILTFADDGSLKIIPRDDITP